LIYIRGDDLDLLISNKQDRPSLRQRHSEYPSKDEPQGEARMKDWLKIAFAVVCSLLSVGVILLVSSTPRGQAIHLSPPPSPAPIIVHLVGAVLNPGVYSLSPGSRLKDAIEIAGGLLPEADTDKLNLAASLVDGSQIVVPTLPPAQPTVETASRSGDIPLLITETDHLVNINTATQAELESLPWIGPALAQGIIAYREANGPFESIEDIIEVYGIGPSIFENIKNLITTGEIP
jgi:competence protein ComEA